MVDKSESFEDFDSGEKNEKKHQAALTRWRVAVIEKIRRSLTLAGATGAFTTLAALSIVSLGAIVAQSDSRVVGIVIMGVGLLTLDAGRQKAVAAARAQGVRDAMSTIFAAGGSVVVIAEKNGRPHVEIHKKYMPDELLARRAAIMEVALQEILEAGEPNSVECAKAALRAIADAGSIS